jgi:hypothetical protein
MSKDKEIINKLFKIVAQQQQILTKLAQVPPASLSPQDTTKKEAQVILNALAPAVKATVEQLVVVPQRDVNLVKVKFRANKGTVMAWNALKQTITDLQNKNVLSGSSYNMIEVK